MHVGKGRLFACFTPDPSFKTGGVVSDDTPTPAPSGNGLITGHAYSISKAIEFRGRKFLRYVSSPFFSSWSNAWVRLVFDH